MKDKLFLALNFGLFGFIFFHLAKQTLQFSENGWFVGHINLYGDLVYHLSLINKFLQDNKILIDNPIFAGTRVNYPIFVDYITAQISRISGLYVSLFLTTFLGGLFCIYVARRFTKKFVVSEDKTFITLLLFFFNGGLGFTYFAKDFKESGQTFFNFLNTLPREYTNIQSEGYWWINNYLAYFLPQRGFLYAFPITLFILLLLYNGTKNQKTKNFIAAGLLTGVLPIIQAHSFFLVFLLSAFYAPATLLIVQNKKNAIINWTIFAVTTAVISTPIFKTISSNQNLLKFIKIDPGWTSNENIIWFWFKNLGLFAPVLLISIIWLFKKNKLSFFLYLPFLLIFVISNIFVFQPWNFDNSKLLIYWYFASTIVASIFIKEYFFTKRILKKITGSLLIFLMIFSASLDIFRTFTPKTNYQIFSLEDLKIAEIIKKRTPKNSIFVTASNHTHPIPSLTGRSTLLGFHGWVWSHGNDFQTRAEDISKIYKGGDDFEEIIKKYKVDYIALGPNERAEFIINEDFFEKFPKIQVTDGLALFDVRNLRL